MIKEIERTFSKRARSARAEIFKKYLNPTQHDKILDLGGAMVPT
jgi:hypothetical protein